MDIRGYLRSIRVADVEAPVSEAGHTLAKLDDPPFSQPDIAGILVSDSSEMMIYHVVTPTDWQDWRDKTYYEPKAFPSEGFIHCCEFQQLQHVTTSYFAGHDNLLVLCIMPERLTALIRYEDLTNSGIPFPHLYGPLNKDAIRRVVRLDRSPDGTFRFPEELRAPREQ